MASYYCLILELDLIFFRCEQVINTQWLIKMKSFIYTTFTNYEQSRVAIYENLNYEINYK